MVRRMWKAVKERLFTVKVNPEIVTLQSSILSGKNIIITGGGRGLGLALAKKFKTEHANVLICGRNEESLKTEATNLGCEYLVLDVTACDDFDEFIRQAEEKLGDINTLVNNAGVSYHENSLQAVTYEGMLSQFKTNLFGPYFLTQAFVKRLKEKKSSGSVVFISSEAGDTDDIRPYGLTKASLNSFIKGLAHFFKLDGIRVNAVSPGITATEMTGLSKDNLYAAEYGAGRFYLPEEVAEVASFLVSDLSGCISGQIITCNNAETVNARWKK